MKSQEEVQISDPEIQEINFVAVDEKMLPELIQGQIIKLRELNESVTAALEAAKSAEEKAKKVKNLSASWSLFGDKKKDAIEGLQEVGAELAEAVQYGAKAQKLSFEFQTRLADVTKYLFNLGVGNIVANRVVVRELELRLSGASKEQLSELARNEVISVIRQLKDQEDLLRKQERMQERLKEQDSKVRHLLDRTDDLMLCLDHQTIQQGKLVMKIDVIDQRLDTQQISIVELQAQSDVHKVGLETLIAGQTKAKVQFVDASNKLLARSDNLELRLNQQDNKQVTSENTIDFIAQASKQQQKDIHTLQQQVFSQQVIQKELATSLAKLRMVLNLCSALLVGLGMVLSATVYFLR